VENFNRWRDAGPRIAKSKGCESSECVCDAGSCGFSEAAAPAEMCRHSGHESSASIVADVRA
jgi:hypothetical protein